MEDFKVIREKKKVNFHKFIILKSARLVVSIAQNHVRDETERNRIFDEAEESARLIGFRMLDLIISDEMFHQNYLQSKDESNEQDPQF